MLAELVIIVSSFNRVALMKQALETLTLARKELPTKSAVIVVDAGSTDGTLELLEAHPEWEVDLVREPGITFSAGVNLGVETGTRLNPAVRWVLLYETDNQLRSAEPLAQAIEVSARHPELAGVCFSVRGVAGGPAGFGGRFPDWRSLAAGQQLSHRLRLEQPRLDWREENGARWSYLEVGYTSPMLFRVEAWQQAGGFDARNFPFSECDVDLAWRLNKAGWKLAVLETSDVIHDNQAQLSSWSNDRALKWHRARRALLLRHGLLPFFPLEPILMARHLAELIISSLIPSRKYLPRLRAKWRLLTSAARGYDP